MSTPIAFAFNQEQLKSLIASGLENQPVGTQLVISFCNISYHSEIPNAGEVYICAEIFDSQHKPLLNLDVILGCPVPPGWIPPKAGVKVEHSQLVFSPRFSLGLNEINWAISRNDYMIEEIRQVVAQIEARIIDEYNQPELESYVSFKIKDRSGRDLFTVEGLGYHP